MKEVIFIRHAKSDWGHEFLKDIDRPLNERGYLDAYAQSEWYSQHHPAPDLIISSTASRAMNTAFIFARHLELPHGQVSLEQGIYESPAASLLNIISTPRAGINRLMLFGHNPGITNICNELTDDVFFDNIPTCGIVSFSFSGRGWKSIGPKKGKLNFYRFPKDFKNHE